MWGLSEEDMDFKNYIFELKPDIHLQSIITTLFLIFIELQYLKFNIHIRDYLCNSFLPLSKVYVKALINKINEWIFDCDN